jgi:PKD repeat protein
MSIDGRARLWTRLARVAAAPAAFGLVVVGLQATPAVADTAPVPPTPATVSAGALPTWQINGVVWAQVVVGTTVYATGSFTQARPPGVAVGGAGSIAANNIFAYNITTGNPVPGFNLQLNAQGNSIAASPDGSTVYVGGDFTTVNGAARGHLAAFSTATNTLSTSFAPTLSARVGAIAVSSSAVYVGGNFFSAGGKSRSELAAFNPANGALLPWAPVAGGGNITAMTLTPGGDRLIVGGQVATLNGAQVNGMGSLDSATGANEAWAANQQIMDWAPKAGFTSLVTDGTLIYGSGYNFGANGGFEGTFAAQPDTGAIVWVNDCHGDTYSVFPEGQVLYAVSHTHSCEWIGAYKNTSPWTFHHATAYTTYPTGTNTGPDDYGWNFAGLPDSSPLQWWPTLGIGSYTKQYQAAWSVTGATGVGSSNYVALGGEFPTVNGVAQQGLTRFASGAAANLKVGPVYAASLTPTAMSVSSGSARVGWQATWDQDNQNLTYNVFRDGGATPVYTVTQASTFWQLPTMGFVDTGLTPGSTHTYRVQVVDPDGNKTGSGTSNTVTISSATPSAYFNDVVNDGAGSYWRLDEPSGSIGFDSVGFNDLTEGSGVGHGAPGAIAGDPDTASTFTGDSTGSASTATAVPGPNTFTAEAWFKTTTSSGGKIVGFGSQQTGSSNNYDRQIYMDNSGHLVFGVYNNGVYTASSAGTYNDGNWHYVVGTLSASGLAFYVDGKKVGTNGGTTVGQSYNGYWRVGGDNLNGWPSQPTSNFFAGTIDEVAIYPNALSLAQVQKHYTDAGGTVTIPTAPTDSYGKAVYNSSPDIYWRLDDAAGATTALDTSPNQDNGVVSGGVTFGTPSPVSGNVGSAASFDGTSGTIGSVTSFNNPTVYSEEVWFNTTSTAGGKLVGFGNQQTGNSTSYDRHIYMDAAGHLNFGTWTGTSNVATSPLAYNDGKWHQAVATQGPDGMTLYVDGQPVATNPQTQAQAYTGYWRVGGDSSWSGNNYFAGTIDEVSIYASTELTAAQVLAHYQASPAAVITHTPPTASFTAPSCTVGSPCTFTSTSTQGDSAITGYDWDFGDGTAHGSSATVTHTFTTAGSMNVKLTVTDANSLTGTVTNPVTVSAPAAPVASIATPSCTNLQCSFDGSGSTGAAPLTYAWDFGDGTGTSTQAKPSYTYAVAGTYTVTLKVTDATNQTSAPVSVSVTVTAVVHTPPTASFVAPSCTVGSPCTFTSTSTQGDSAITGYDWDFGDGTAHGSSATVTHTFTTAGSMNVKLTVTDANSLTGTVTNPVTVSAPAAPVASIATPSCTNLQCSFDGSGSTGAAPLTYAWDFGDGTGTSTQAKPSYTYAAAGTYTVTLKVTDATNQTSAPASVSVTVTAAPTLYASDAFARTITNGWGSADLGGAWSPLGSSASFSVAGGTGMMTVSKAGSGPSIFLNSVSSTNTDVQVTFSSDKAATGGGIYVYVAARRPTGAGDYRAKIHLLSNGTVGISLLRTDSAGAETSLTPETVVTGITYTPGLQLRIRVQAFGTTPTTLRARVWLAGGTEPGVWQVTSTDSTAALQAAGGVGLKAYLSSSTANVPVTLSYSAFQAGPAN